MARHFLAFSKEPNKFQELDTFQESVGRIAPERIDHAISSFVRISVAFAWLFGEQVAWHYIWPALRERPSPEI